MSAHVLATCIICGHTHVCIDIAAVCTYGCFIRRGQAHVMMFACSIGAL